MNVVIRNKNPQKLLNIVTFYNFFSNLHIADTLPIKLYFSCLIYRMTLNKQLGPKNSIWIFHTLHECDGQAEKP